MKVFVVCILYVFTFEVHPLPDGSFRKRSLNEDMQSDNQGESCKLPDSLVDEIKSYKDVSQQIINHVINGPFKGRCYKELENFVDTFGPRFSGTPSLEASIDFAMDRMKAMNLENVHGDQAIIPQWVRGYENAEMILPRRKNIAILGIGYTIGTPHGGLEASVIVVKDFDELKHRASEVKGKIVVYNKVFREYMESSRYRKLGAVEAAKLGAVASLTRSVGPKGLYTPHTGSMSYYVNVTKIPAACITIEDSELFQRLQDKGEKIVIRLVMNDYELSPFESRNAVADIIGREKPEETVIVAAHIDSWDVGQGAMDDGGGVIMLLLSLELLKSLNLIPRRTMKAILWTGEEMGLVGAHEYLKRHKDEIGNISVMMETDAATFKPLGLDMSGSPEAICIVKEVLKLLSPINATSLYEFDRYGSDVDVFIPHGVPAIGLHSEGEKRFWYHHTNADTMTALDEEELDLCTAAWAVSTFVLADISVKLPRISET